MAFGPPVIQAYLTSSRLRVCRVEGVLRKRAGAAVQSAVAEHLGDGPRWNPALNALRSALDAHASSRFQLDVVLGDEWLRYALLPSFDMGLRTLEIAGLAHSVMQRTYGDSIQNWTVRVTAAGERALLAAAMDPEMLRAIEETASAAGGRLRAVVPALVQLLERIGTRARRACWVVALEPAAAAIALYSDGDLRALRVRRSPVLASAVLMELLERERLRIGTDVRDVLVCGEPADWLELPQGWTLRGDAAMRPLLDCDPPGQAALAPQAAH